MGWLSKVKKVAKKVGRAVVGTVSSAINVAGEIAGRFIGLPSFLLDLFIPWPRKKLRLRILILNDENGDPISPDRDLVRESQDAYKLAKDIFMREANVKIITYGNLDKVEVLDSASPKEALEPRCGDGGVFKDHFGKAGTFFITNKQYSISILLLGNGAPITAFIVRDVDSAIGCSPGAFADYVTVDLDGLIKDADDDVVVSTASETLAHELGHSCGLEYMRLREHHPQKSNLMYMNSDRTGTKLKRYQVALLRNSRFVTYL